MNLIKIFGFLILGLSLTFMSCSSTDDGVILVEEMDMEEDSNNDDGNALDSAPDFTIETTAGTTISSAQFEGKTMVIFFFGSECPPCIAVGPDVESKLHQEFKSNENFAIIGIDQWDRNNATVDDFQQKTGVSFPLGVKGSSIASEFKTTYDRLVIVNSDGKIDYKGNSIAANNLDTVISRVKDLLN